ncbi:hypothetical protein JH06_4495 [Blastocystis sp. subtype 4]|uniref:hypothetical protein n=1 Tax=Blastocystis sp. subtype 4 TaxID=944170 RepID=UPI00071194B6|nr:hypothetical protein JH06_4495 [Blastocystis sp. subtype 4]KNB42200.1 hypothetical protein JH06_4495 [Blastocystis sp. subtype 4]|eukprot:XP_014525643.1 hypothetical protein JH06_4495 [Blastocystis sp. subtype 4]
MTSTNNCFVHYNVASTAYTGFSNAATAISWTRNSAAQSYSSPGSITFEFSGSVKSIFNSFRIWPYTYPTRGPSIFILEGAMSTTSTWETVASISGAVYTASEWNQWNMVSAAPQYPLLKFTAQESQETPISIYEIQFLVCNRPIPTAIDYPETQYSYLRYYEQVNIAPSSFGYSGCLISPALPDGVSIDPNTCIISGRSNVASPLTSYQITSQVGTTQLQASISIAFTECTGAYYKIVRTYKTSPQNEYFRIRDTSNDNIVYEIESGHSHTANADWTHYLCITVDRFDVTFDSTSAYWYSGSYYYMYLMLSDGEEEMVLKGRYDSNQGNVHTHYLRRPSINHSEQWYYKMGEVPTNWHSAETSGWQQAARGSFPTSANRIQLYKKTFNIASLNEVSGLILSIRYRYGVIVYLNGNEAWRNGVIGDLSTSSTVDNSYTDLKYYVVTLPGKQIQTSTVTSPVTFLQSGINTIAIAIVAIADSYTTSYFDAVVRLMSSEQSESHIWEFTATTSGFYSSGSNPFDMYYSTYITAYSCIDNSLTITLSNNRREWISSVQIQNYYSTLYSSQVAAQFNLYGRNSNDDEWTLLKEVTGLTYSTVGQKRRIYFINNTPYNQFKFENFGTGNPSSCSWYVQSLDLFADNVLVDIPNFTYDSSVTVFKDIEMAEVIPQNGDGYFNFRINPSLPAGIVLDSQTGWISGTATSESTAQTYTITATNVAGGDVTDTISLSVSLCSGAQGLMTVRIRADGYPSENSWKLYEGRGTSGAVLRSVSPFPVSNTYYYVDFCLENGFYTFEGSDSFGDGWSIGTGYTLTVDMGEMELDIMEMNRQDNKPIYVSTVFSTYFPFQIEYTDWKVIQTDVSSDWNTVSFDDSTWNTYKAVDIPSTSSITTYIRKSFTMSGVNDYQVLNVRVKYSGGVAAYLNGNLVARFNLAEDFDSLSLSITDHDANVFSKFHVILATAGIEEGNNVFSFEIHRPLSGTTADPVLFDATGVFGVEDCSTVVDSYSSLTSTTPNSGTVDAIMDLDPYTTGLLPNTIGTYIDWTIENLVGSKWNSFNMVGGSTVTSWGFEITGFFNPDDQQEAAIIILDSEPRTITQKTKPQISVPVALAGFRRYRWEVTDTGSTTTSLGSIHMAYCKASGSVCPGIGNYPSVGEGQISPSSCETGYRGYSYRECSGGVLGEVKTDQCVKKPPTNARYRSSQNRFVMGTVVTTGVPSVNNIVDRWYIDEGVTLPNGLSLDSQTGEISGTPTDIMDLTTYTVYAENESGATQATVSIQVRKGTCMAEGVFPVTYVGETAVYECSSQGSYVGTQKRACILGSEDGEWQNASGFCTSVLTIVVIVVVAVVIIAVAIFLLVRAGKKAKAVGGVKGKKTVKKSKASNVASKTKKQVTI